MPARLVPILLLLLVAMAASACGGTADDDPDRQLSKREYIERNNELQRDAATVLTSIDGRVATTPAQAARYLAALDDLAAGLEALRPPDEWRDEHRTMLDAARTMRQSMAIVSRASPRNAGAIRTQLARSAEAQERFQDAVRDVNASR